MLAGLNWIECTKRNWMNVYGVRACEWACMFVDRINMVCSRDRAKTDCDWLHQLMNIKIIMSNSVKMCFSSIEWKWLDGCVQVCVCVRAFIRFGRYGSDLIKCGVCQFINYDKNPQYIRSESESVIEKNQKKKKKKKPKTRATSATSSSSAHAVVPTEFSALATYLCSIET